MPTTSTNDEKEVAPQLFTSPTNEPSELMKQLKQLARQATKDGAYFTHIIAQR